jgi:hypothetical protein
MWCSYMVQRAQRTIERHFIYLFIYLFTYLFIWLFITYVVYSIYSFGCCTETDVDLDTGYFHGFLGKKKKEKKRKSDACEHSGPL